MADHNENLKDTLNEEIEHADQKPAEEHYSLNDDRRVKVLSPGMLVAKRFFRNRLAVTGMAILVFMFVFSFIGGLISPYEQDKFFYADKTIRREFAAVIKNTEFRYSSADDSVFGLPAQAQAMLAIQQQKDGFTYRDNRFTLTKEAEDFYSVSVNGQVVGLAYKSVVSPSASDATLSFEFTYQALKAYLTDGADTFTADGKTYTVDESGSVMDGATEVAYVSPYVVQALMPDVFLSRDFKDKLIDTINAGGEKFTYTDESLIVDEEPATDEEDGTNSAITPDDSQMPDDTPRSATAEYDISFDAATNSWSVLQEQTSRQYDKYSAPSKEHLMGTDGYGMDMLTRLMYGGRVSLMIGFIVIVIETVIGVIFGGIAGYFGGWVDNLIMRVVDIFYCIPSMPIIIILGAAMDAQRVDGWLRMIYLMLILGFLGWAGIARLVRGQILSLREQEFMTATEACGISVSRRIFKHLIPNVIPQLIVNCTMGLGSVIITEATLSFLGLGVKFPFASWGNIISDVNNTHVLTTYWFIWIPAGVLLLLTVLAFNLVGAGCGSTLVEQHFAVAADEDKRSMSSRDDGHGLAAGSFRLHFDIELVVDVFFQADCDPPLVDHAAAALNSLRRHVAQHLQQVLRTPDQRPEGYGDRQADHPRTGDSDAHGILEDVGAQAHRDFPGLRAQRLRRTRRTEGHGYRLGTSDSRDHLPVDKVNDSFAFRLGYHAVPG